MTATILAKLAPYLVTGEETGGIPGIIIVLLLAALAYWYYKKKGK